MYAFTISKFVVMFLVVRPVTEDEHLYLRLCKLGKLILFFKLSGYMLKVI